MSKKYTIRYTIKRPALTDPFWIRDDDTPSSYEEIQDAAHSLDGTHEFQISFDGLSVNIDYTFDSEELREKFVELAYKIDEKYQKNHKKEWDERNEHHEKYGLIEETTFFEETS
jgi:hypothetical protein